MYITFGCQGNQNHHVYVRYETQIGLTAVPGVSTICRMSVNNQHRNTNKVCILTKLYVTYSMKYISWPREVTFNVKSLTQERFLKNKRQIKSHFTSSSKNLYLCHLLSHTNEQIMYSYYNRSRLFNTILIWTLKGNLQGKMSRPNTKTQNINAFLIIRHLPKIPSKLKNML